MRVRENMRQIVEGEAHHDPRTLRGHCREVSKGDTERERPRSVPEPQVTPLTGRGGHEVHLPCVSHVALYLYPCINMFIYFYLYLQESFIKFDRKELIIYLSTK